MPSPYDEVLLGLRDGKDATDLMGKVGVSLITSCKNAAEKVNGAGLDYITALERAYLHASVGKKLEPLVDKLSRGEEADVGKVLSELGRLEREQKVFTPMSDVDPKAVIWRPTFYAPIDKYLQGLPESSLCVCGGPPGTGKSTLLIRLMIEAAKNGRRTAFFSLEMTMNQIAHRMLEVEKKLSKKERALILTTDSMHTHDEIYAHASKLATTYPDLYMIGVDFADMIVPERRSYNEVAQIDEIYRTMAGLAKKIGVPVVVLSQLNYNYVGGRPRLNHLRGSRLIEALAAVVILLYNPEQVDVDQGQGKRDNTLPFYPGKAYIQFAKSRYGFVRGTTGAVRVAWDGARGWGAEDGVDGWTSLASV
jgi:replicative DNA helicase